MFHTLVKSEFALVCNLLYLTLRTFGRTLLQSPVWDDSYVGTYRECSKKILALTWWCFAVVPRAGLELSTDWMIGGLKTLTARTYSLLALVLERRGCATAKNLIEKSSSVNVFF